MSQAELLPVVPGTIGNSQCLTVDGRTLHGALGVKRDFATWMKARISKYGFVEGQDYEKIVNDFTFPQTGELSHNDFKTPVEYRLETGMAKELCMVENNEAGRVARRYFIECERQLILQGNASLPSSSSAPALEAPDSSRLSKRSDPERKELTAIINVWVSNAPIHYAGARSLVNAHFGVDSVDKLTVAQVREAIAFVQGKIDSLPKVLPGPEQISHPLPSFDIGMTYSAIQKDVEVLESYLRAARDANDSLSAFVNKVCRKVLSERGVYGTARLSTLGKLSEANEKAFYALNDMTDCVRANAHAMRLFVEEMR